ncbi:MAG: hypothetical protein ACE5E8_03430 [Acidimicrobiia bacterium]
MAVTQDDRTSGNGGWIETVDPKDATGILKEAYDRQNAALGEVAEFTRLSSLYPSLTAVRLELYRVVDSCPSALPEWVKHAIALTTSVLNTTPHCASGLFEKLVDVGGEQSMGERIYASPKTAQTGDEAVDALLDYVRTVVSEPWAVTEDDLNGLRSHGWTDLDILDANNICSYYCYINRVANGLGLKTLTAPAPPIGGQ